MKQPTRPKTAAQVRAEFAKCGLSVASWSRDHGFHPSLVYEILNGNERRRCLRGKSHRVAVLLGMKHGELVSESSAVNAVLAPAAAK
jgi:gp16 family phage-associated protein